MTVSEGGVAPTGHLAMSIIFFIVLMMGVHISIQWYGEGCC